MNIKKRCLNLIFVWLLILCVCSIVPVIEYSLNITPVAFTAEAKSVKKPKPVGRVKNLIVTKDLKHKFYLVGSALDTTGLKLKAYFKNGAVKTISASDCTITGFKSNKECTKKVKFKYKNKSVKIEVNIIQPLEAPTLTQVTQVTSGIKTMWGSVENATGYLVYRKADDEPYKRVFKTQKATRLWFTDKEIEQFTYCQYKVKAFAGTIKGISSKASEKIENKKEIDTKIFTPIVQRVTNGQNNVMVKWKKISDVTGYYVLRKTEDTEYKKIATVNGDDMLFYKDYSVEKGKTYQYTVQAYKGKFLSSYNATGKTITYTPLTKIKSFGIDISHWQGNFDFDRAVDEGIEFAIIKAGGGDAGIYKDSMFERYYAELKKRNLPVGVYWYTGATTPARAKQEAKYFYENVLYGKQFEYPIFIDVEEQYIFNTGDANVANIIQTWCEYLENKGYYTGIYGSLSYYKYYMNAPKLSAYAHWVACWGTSCAYYNYDCYGIWQFGGETNLLRSNQIAGQTCDQDYGLINYVDIIKEAHLNGF